MEQSNDIPGEGTPSSQDSDNERTYGREMGEDETSTVEEIKKVLNLDPSFTFAEPLYLMELYKNLHILNRGDKKLMRYWVHCSNRHLGYTPKFRVQFPWHLREMVGYLDSLISR